MKYRVAICKTCAEEIYPEILVKELWELELSLCCIYCNNETTFAIEVKKDGDGG